MKTLNQFIECILIIFVLFTFTLLSSEPLQAHGGWLPQASETTNNLNSVCFINPSTGWIVGANDVILITYDGGLSWTPAGFSSPLNDEFTFKAICFSNLSTGWAAGELYRSPPGQHYRVIINTTNSGDNWSVIYNECESGLNSICYRNIDAGFAAGPNTILKSTDLGKSWIPQQFQILKNEYYIFRTICFISPNTGWVGGDLYMNPSKSYYQTILKTEDGGASWTRQYLGDYPGLNSINFPTPLNGWAAGYNIILKTSNGGTNWIEKVYGNKTCDYYFNSVFFLNSNSQRGWIVGGMRCIPGSGYSKVILLTTDGGVGWTEVSIPAGENNYQLRSVFFINEMTGWTVGDSGTILKTTNGGFTFTTGIESKNNTIPKSYGLYQNYPNPFNPVTKIKFEIPLDVKGKTSDVKLIIYDILGKEVATPVNEKLQPGTYEATFDGSNLPSGVYFYKLNTGVFTDTKRMILIK